MEFWEEILETPPNKEETPKKEEPKVSKQKVKKKRSQLPALIVLIILLVGIFIYIQWPRYEMNTLGTLDGSYGTAVAINNKGQIAGWVKLSNGNSHAFIWDQENGIRDIGTIGGNNSFATGINDKGHVVGYSENIDGRI